uniref:Cytochrome P450 n=1 Tax=Oryza rufipogon TaxID=4529 RepID=A0A0E0Q6T1_ORYRU
MADDFLSSQPQPWPPLLQLSAAVLFFLLPLLYLLFLRGSNGEARGRQGNSASAPSLPGPCRQLPVLGNLLQIGSRPHRYFQAVSRRYGPVVQVQLGGVRTVVVHSPEAAEDVLRTNDVHCCSRPPSPGIDYWREMRKLFVVELTSVSRVHSFAYARAAEVARLVDTLAASPPGIPVDLSCALYQLLDGIIGTVAFGKVYGAAQWSPERAVFQDVLSELLLVLGSFSFEDFFPSSALARWADALAGVERRRRRIFRQVDGFLDSVIDKHLEPERLSAGVQEDMVDALNTFAGGIDTTAITAIWIMSELMRNPRVMQKAQAEVRNTVKNKPLVDEEDIQNLKYLEMIIKENFRLHPPWTLLVPRQTMQPCLIGGYNVPSGTRVFINIWAMGRDPMIWDNPEEFYPERFEDRNIDFRGSHFELVPFGSGRRICPGIAMAVASLELVVANLLYCFD